MANQKRKSIAEIISRPISKKPSSAEIEQITSKIHQPEKIPTSVEKTKRIGINAPISLYLKAKTKSTLQDQTLMAYVMGLIEADVSK
jgi:hypothetical protein